MGQSLTNILSDEEITNWANSLNTMALATDMSVEEMNSMLNSIGVQANVTVKEVDTTAKVPVYHTTTTNLDDGDGDPNTTLTETSSYIVRYDPIPSKVPVAQIDMGEGGSSPDIKYIGSTSLGGGSTGSSSSGGGGGSKPKKATPTKKSNVVERYKPVEDKLDDIRDEADKTKNSLDRLYGEEQEQAIERLLELEQQEIDLMKQKAAEAEKYLQEDLADLNAVALEVGIEFNIDDKGNLENYEEEMTKLYEELAAVEKAAGDEWDENEQEEIDLLNEKIEKLKEAISVYEETRELLEDINMGLDEMAGK